MDLAKREDAEDAYVRAFRAFGTFAGSDPRPWLLAIVRNVAYSAFEAHKQSRNVIGLTEDWQAEKRAQGAGAASPDPSPETGAVAQQDHGLLLEA